MSSDRVTVPSSAYRRMLAFFDLNPDEELTMRDIAEKFGVAQKTAYAMAQRATRDGLLESVHVVRKRVRA